MLEDRHYMREPSRGPAWSATIVLLVINVVVFLLQPIVFRGIDEGYFALSLFGLKHGYVWQLVTFQFLHAGWLHIIFNSLALFFFGRTVEAMLGRMRFLQLYFASGIMGGLLQVLLALVIPRYFDTAVVGASAGVSGLIAAFAVMNWENRFTLLIYFFPVTMRGRTLFWASIVLTIIGILSPNSGVAHAAHLGGFLTGAAFIRFGIGLREMPWQFRPFDNRRRKRGLVKAALTKIPGWPSSKDVISADVPEEEFISQEVAPILDKISAPGIQSLTDRERAILERARSKMGKR
ncbi:MAG: rhomboid family intramembrane serine protease [Verrucomicrobiota bacterium]